MKQHILKTLALFSATALLASCSKSKNKAPSAERTISVENVLQSDPLVESGVFQGQGSPALIQPGHSVSFQFSAARGEAVTFATMYGASNDLFFAPVSPGIQVYDASGNPIEGDVSSQVKLWDNGTRINQKPGAAVTHPGTAETIARNIAEVSGTDAQGNTYLPAPSLMGVSLKYNGNSMFTLTITNNSGGTANETPFSPGVWAISYIVGGNLLNANPLYVSGTPTANGLTNLAEMGDNTALDTYIKGMTGIFTPLSPVLVVVYNGIDNPIFQLGSNDPGKGLKDLAQKGDASGLATYLRGVKGVKNVYVLPAAGSTVLLPVMSDQAGSRVSQQLSVVKGDKIAIATMYGFSNDWFFANADGVDATESGDISSAVALYDDGTAIDQFPGAGITQFNLAGTPLADNKPIMAVPNPNPFTTLPAITGIIKVTLQ